HAVKRPIRRFAGDVDVEEYPERSVDRAKQEIRSHQISRDRFVQPQLHFPPPPGAPNQFTTSPFEKKTPYTDLFSLRAWFFIILAAWRGNFTTATIQRVNIIGHLSVKRARPSSCRCERDMFPNYSRAQNA